MNGETVHGTESPCQKSLQLAKNGEGSVVDKSHSSLEMKNGDNAGLSQGWGGGRRMGELVWPLKCPCSSLCIGPPWRQDIRHL